MKLTQTFLLACAFLILCAAGSRAATLVVDTTADDAALTICAAAAPNDCSLRGAIASAAAGDTITFDPGLFMITRTIRLTNGELFINKALTINGVGGVIVSGNNASRVFRVSGTFTTQINLSGMTITGGNSSSSSTGGGIDKFNTTLTLTDMKITGNTASLAGGGIYSAAGGTLNIINSSVSDNTSGTDGGGITLLAAGSTMTVNISGSNVTGNSARNGGGVFIQSAAGSATNLTLTNSAIIANTATLGGGGYFYGSAFGTQSLTNVLISNNRAGTDGGGFAGRGTLTNVTVTNNFATGNGGGIVTGSPTILRNSIAADNTASGSDPDVSGAITSQGNNLVRNRGASVGYDPTDLPDGTNPLLDTLKNNGGLSPTYALAAGSPAINAGNNSLAAGASDQRGAGYARIVGGIVDIGAFEVQGSTAASVNIRGRVLTEAGGGVPNAQVMISSSQAGVCFANTNPFGFYRFNGVPAGETYVFDVRSKRFLFATQVLTVFEDTTDLNFTAQPKP